MSVQRNLSIGDLLWLEAECIAYFLDEPEHALGLCGYLQSKTWRNVYTIIHCIRDEYEGGDYGAFVDDEEGPTPKRLDWVYNTLLPAIRDALRGIPGPYAEEY